MELIILKYALKAIKIANRYRLRKKAEKKQSSPLRRMSFNHRITLLVAMIFVAVCLFAVTPGVNIWFANATQSVASSPSSIVSSLAETDAPSSAVAVIAQHTMTLRDSGAASLTMYPDKSTNVLSSATVDEKTANLSYMRNAGKGGVTSTLSQNKSGINAPPPVETPSQICSDEMSKVNSMKYVGSNANLDATTCALPTCNASKGGGDFLTGCNDGASGALFVILPDLTYNNPTVTNLLTGMQLVAGSFITILILLLGLSFMTGRGSFRYADLIELVPRLMLGIVGIIACQPVAQFAIDAINTVSAMFMSLLVAGANPAGNINLGDVIDIVMPAHFWLLWIIILNTLGLALMIANVVAPLMILGNDFGAFISIAILVLLYALVPALAPEFIKTSFSMIIAGQAVIRFILIDLYIVLSPIAVISIGLPGQVGVGFARDWIMGFLSLVVSQFAVVVVLGIGVAVQGYYKNTGHQSDIVLLIMHYAILGLMIRVPSLFKTNAVGMIGQAGSAAASMAHHEITPFAPK